MREDRTDTYPHVSVEGGPRERGRQYGEAARERVHRSVEAYREVFEAYAGWDWARVEKEAARFEAPIRAFSPTCLEEIEGIAEGAGVATTDILAINVRTEVMFSARARDASIHLPPECTSFAALPSATAEGHTLIGQNWDWLLHSFDTVVVLEAVRDDGPNFVTVVEAGLLAKTGMNAAGIGLATNALVSGDDRGEPGVPYHVLLRALLDAEDLPSALAILQRGWRSSSANYLLAHRDGTACDVEASPGDFTSLHVLFPDRRGLLFHTNHFVSPRFTGRDVSLWVMPDSPFRLDRAGRLADEIEGPVTPQHLQSILSDHGNHPLGICCHPDDRHAPLDQGASVASVIMDLDSRTMWVSDGNPCTAPYRQLDYGELLAPGAARREPAHAGD
jgi:isopenicillin-N N-acyltransferase like protein